MIKKHAWAIFYSIFLVLFTAYMLLDTFVITRVYTAERPNSGQEWQQEQGGEAEPDEESMEEPAKPLDDPSSAEPEAEEIISTANYYSDQSITISLTEYRENDTTVYVADVTLSSPQYLKTALAQGAYGRNVTEKTSDISERAGAILAINGDYYGSRPTGYVLRNGNIYREEPDTGREDLVIYNDGTFGIITEGETDLSELLQDGASQVLSFGPALLIDGEICVTQDDEVGRAMASNPRTAIAVVDDLHYLLVVSDGRTEESEGLTLLEMAEFLQSLGADCAYNLDGGGSSTMYFNGEGVNNPTTNGRTITEREVSDIVYIGY